MTVPVKLNISTNQIWGDFWVVLKSASCRYVMKCHGFNKMKAIFSPARPTCGIPVSVKCCARFFFQNKFRIKPSVWKSCTHMQAFLLSQTISWLTWRIWVKEQDAWQPLAWRFRQSPSLGNSPLKTASFAYWVTPRNAFVWWFIRPVMAAKGTDREWGGRSQT